MFEISIFCVVLLAGGYWATLWTMGRREDVLHGNFVETEPPQAKPRPSADALQSLLASIKQDLNDAARK